MKPRDMDERFTVLPPDAFVTSADDDDSVLRLAREAAEEAEQNERALAW